MADDDASLNRVNSSGSLTAESVLVNRSPAGKVRKSRVRSAMTRSSSGIDLLRRSLRDVRLTPRGDSSDLSSGSNSGRESPLAPASGCTDTNMLCPISDAVYLSGTMQYLRAKQKAWRSKKMTTRKVILSPRDLRSVEEGKGEEKMACEVFLIESMVLTDDTTIVLSLSQPTDVVVVLQHEQRGVVLEWFLAINTVSCNNFCRRLIPEESESIILKEMMLEPFSGGLIKRLADEEEEWIYNGGRVYQEGGKKYEWDGQTFKEDKSKDGEWEARWTGGILTFPKKDSETPMHFRYVPETKEYISDSMGVENAWKWTRHFLAAKNGKEKTWLVEGSVPEHVVMILQGLRYSQPT